MAYQIPASSAGLAARRAAVVSCWLCGIRLQHSLMVPDGGSACLDVRWYCQDTGACTERWTSARHQDQPEQQSPAAGSVVSQVAAPAPMRTA